MTPDVLMERLKMMMADAESKANGKANGKPKADPAPKAEAPKAKAKPAPVAVEEADEDEPSDGGVCPVVVLDDGQTFSNIGGCKVCFVNPDAEDIDQETLDHGVSIEDLMTLFNAITAIRKILG